MSQLTDAIAELEKKPTPKIEAWVAGLDQTDRDALLVAAANPNIPTRHLHEVVKTAGCAVGRDLFTAWRKANGLPS